VKVIVEVRDVDAGRASSYTVANYVKAALKVRALRRELGQALLEVERWKKALKRRLQADVLVAEAEALLKELEAEAAGDDAHSGS
jgi:hypothetical protein